MTRNRLFKSQDYGSPIYKHSDLFFYITNAFNFFRCVEFKEEFYSMTASDLFHGNLRECTGRYSKLFPNQKLSYWADSPLTARAEIKRHGAGNNILTFWAYDDGSSTFPTLFNQEPLRIIDGRKCGIQEIIDKAEAAIPLTDAEENYIAQLLALEPDCMAYDSHARKGGENFIFFEKGFKKLALRELRLRFGRKDGGGHNRIVCATSCDYTPHIESYGKQFLPKAQIGFNESYLTSEEYLLRKRILKESHQRMRDRINAEI